MTTRLILRLIVPALLLSASLGCGRTNPTAASSTPTAARPESLLDKVRREKVLRVGFAGYPPFLNIDINTKQPADGLSVELIQAIVKEWDPSIKVQWVPTNWTNVRTDLNAGKFDLNVEPNFRTIPRAAIVDYSRPYATFGYAVGLVQINDNRFKNIGDIDRPDVKIAVAQGLGAHEYVTRHLLKATNLKIIPGGQADAPANEVLLKRVDVALVDSTVVGQFLKAHPGALKPVFTDPPPAFVTGAIMFRQGDYRFASFINTAIDYLEGSGEIQRLKQKYGIK